jgi:hypothetical protein
VVTVPVTRPDARANGYRRKVLSHAIGHCNGLIRSIWLTERDNLTPNARIKDVEPDLHTWLRVTSLDPVTGAFTAESV